MKISVRESGNPLETHVGYWMRLVSNQVSGAFARSLGQRDISVAEWVALNQIARQKDVTSSALAASMSMTRGALSKILDKLETKGLVARKDNPDDNRAQLLSLTREARRVLPALTKIADHNDAHFFSVLNAKERDALNAILRKLAALHQLGDVPVE